MPRILVTAAGGALAPLNIRLLREGKTHPAWVLAVDAREDATGQYFADAFATVPLGTDPDYVSVIADLIERHGIDLVLPWSDEEALALSAERDAITEAGATLCCVPLETLRLMSDKDRTYSTLAAAGVATPAWRRVDRPEGLDEVLREFSDRPDGFVVKPTTARGNRGTIVVRPDVQGAELFSGSREWHCDPATFQQRFRSDIPESLPVLVMERLYAPALDIDVLAWKGEVIRDLPRLRLNPAGVPFRGSVLHRTEELRRMAADVTRVLKLSWLYDFDIMTNAAGEARILELNPRPSGSIASGILAGEPFYEDLLALARGIPPAGAEVGVGDRRLTVVPYLNCEIVES